jgi:Holliday junction resolvase RusA-like endonuclease
MKLQLNIDSTSLSNSNCILRFKRHIIGEIVDGQATGGYKQERMPIRMLYGVAVHKFIDMMFKTGGKYPIAVKEARELFNRIPREDDGDYQWLANNRHLEGTCLTVWQSIEEDGQFDIIQLPDGRPATEITFSIPFYEDEIMAVNLCGTIDKIGKFKGGCFAIGDYKNTMTWDERNYFKQYELSRQLRLYTLACKLMAANHPDSTLGRIGSTHMGAFIDAIFVKKEFKDNKFKRSEVFQYSKIDIDNFQQTLLDLCLSLSNHIKQSYFPKEGIVRGGCGYGKMMCQFWNVCASGNGEILLKRDFKQTPFDPLHYNEVGE